VTSGTLSWLACKLGALATAVGALVALTAARLLHVGRFTPKQVGSPA
jgi:hypothetical protein